MTFLYGQIVAGIFVGAFYALIALGYTMVYGVLRLLNFAHGDLYMLGAFMGMSVLGFLGTVSEHNFFVIAGVVVLIMGVTGIVGMLIERIAYRPLRRAPRLSLLITAMGASFSLEYGVMVVPGWGAQYHVFPASLPTSPIHLLSYQATTGQMTVLVVSLVLMLALYWVVSRTTMGRAMRAVSMDKDASTLMGINVNTIIGVTFFLGTALAGAAGMLGGLYYGQINYLMGFDIGLKAFTAAVLGGIGNIPGAMVGGFVLGILQSLGAGYLGSTWADVFTYGILILLLTVRPTGILGERTGVRA